MCGHFIDTDTLFPYHLDLLIESQLTKDNLYCYNYTSVDSFIKQTAIYTVISHTLNWISFLYTIMLNTYIMTVSVLTISSLGSSLDIT